VNSGDAPEGGAPRLLHYFYLNLAVWGFLALQSAILTRTLGSSQTVILLSVVLGLGFLAVCVFDYVWLRARR
jgi:uncharacterized membrane protein